MNTVKCICMHVSGTLSHFIWSLPTMYTHTFTSNLKYFNNRHKCDTICNNLLETSVRSSSPSLKRAQAKHQISRLEPQTNSLAVPQSRPWNSHSDTNKLRQSRLGSCSEDNVFLDYNKSGLTPLNGRNINIHEDTSRRLSTIRNTCISNRNERYERHIVSDKTPLNNIMRIAWNITGSSFNWRLTRDFLFLFFHFVFFLSTRSPQAD